MAVKEISDYQEIEASELEAADWFLVEIASGAFRKVAARPFLLLDRWEIKDEDFAMVAGQHVAADTRTGSITATLPAPDDMVEGDQFYFTDFADTFEASPLLIDPNGNEFADPGDGSDVTEPMTCDGNGVTFFLIFSGGKLRPRG